MASDHINPDGVFHALLESSRAYWESDGARGAPLSLVGADLRRYNLRERVLVDAHLHGADLSGALLDSALVIRASLDGANLSGASLFRSDASRASLVGARLIGAQAALSRWRRTTLSRADLTGMTLTDADLTGAELIDARLDRAALLGAKLDRSVLLRASFAGADLTGASVVDIVGEEGVFDGAVGADAADLLPSRDPASRRHFEIEREFLREVLERLRAAGLTVHAGFSRGPDGVAELEGRRFPAFNVASESSPDRLTRLLERSDMLILTDGASNHGIIERTTDLEGAAGALRQIPSSRIGSHGATAVALRQGQRLRPYLALQDHCARDPAALSRIAGFLEGDAAAASPADRLIAQQLPAHLAGSAISDAFEWTLKNRPSLDQFISKIARLNESAGEEYESTASLARRGLELERDLARRIRRT